jgi:hypothetical protein
MNAGQLRVEIPMQLRVDCVVIARRFDIKCAAIARGFRSDFTLILH